MTTNGDILIIALNSLNRDWGKYRQSLKRAEEDDGFTLLYSWASHGGGMAHSVLIRRPSGDVRLFVTEAVNEYTNTAETAAIAYERGDRIVVMVNPGKAGWTIGKKGCFIKTLSRVVGKRISVMEREQKIHGDNVAVLLCNHVSANLTWYVDRTDRIEERFICGTYHI